MRSRLRTSVGDEAWPRGPVLLARLPAGDGPQRGVAEKSQRDARGSQVVRPRGRNLERRHQKRWHPDGRATLNDMFRRVSGAGGRPPVRAQAAQDMIACDVELPAILQAGRWKSTAMVNRPACGFVVLGQFPVGRKLPHGAAAHGGPDIVPARRNGVSAPCAARPGPGIEKLRIRFDDPVRVHSSGGHGIRAIRNPLRRPKDRGIRQAVAIRRETADDNRSDFGAGTQGREGPVRWIKPSPIAETVDPRDIKNHSAGYAVGHVHVRRAESCGPHSVLSAGGCPPS